MLELHFHQNKSYKLFCNHTAAYSWSWRLAVSYHHTTTITDNRNVLLVWIVYTKTNITKCCPCVAIHNILYAWLCIIAEAFGYVLFLVGPLSSNLLAQLQIISELTHIWIMWMSNFVLEIWPHLSFPTQWWCLTEAWVITSW